MIRIQPSTIPRTTREIALNSSSPSHGSEMEEHKEQVVKDQQVYETKTQNQDHQFGKKYTIKIEKHTIVDEKKPFVLFALEVQSNFSNLQLMRFKDQIVMIRRKDNFSNQYLLETLIPRLPSSFTGIFWKTLPSSQQIERQKESLTKYSQAILDLLYICAFTQMGPNEEEELEEAHVSVEKQLNTLRGRDNSRNQQTKECFNAILNFFQLQEMAKIEQQKARQIQKFFRNIKKDKIKKRLLQLIYQSRGYTINLLNLNDHLLIHILGFLSIKDKFKKFSTVIFRASQLKVLSMKFCPNVSGECLSIIAEEANPFFLRELYLDGCDKINDSALYTLTGRTHRDIQLPKDDSLYNASGQTHLKDFSSLAVNQEEMMQIIKDISYGGARGLEVISFAECRNIQDTGVTHLKNLKYLTKICLLGCSNVKDDSIKELARNLKYLEDVDIGGTYVTAESLRELVTMCLNLKKVNITGCKRLNASDDQVLRQNRINVEGGEDVFRFYLIPEHYSDLPKITNSVLKTRSTLSLHKVYKYLTKKLQTEHIIENVPDDQIADHLVEILCNGVILNPYIQLKEAKDKHWPFADRLLVLNFRRKESLSDIESSSTYIREYQPKKPPLWIPNHLSYSCLKCENDFTFLRRIHHCRNCGKSFCKSCSNNFLPIEQFGYFAPVRVCIDCKNAITAIRDSLDAVLNLRYFPSQLVERQTHPEIEFQDNQKLMLKPLTICKSEVEKCYIEASINSVRVSLSIKKNQEIEELLTHMFERFLALRADKFAIMRKKAAHKDYDFSFLITDEHLMKFKKEELINFILEFIQGIEKEINDMKLAIINQSRIAAAFFTNAIANNPIS